MDNLEKIVTNDGTISFYNKAIGDIYHSRVGAYTEALEKFIQPSQILEQLDNYSCINVFDVCFGLGYNSKVLLSSVLKIDPQKKINIVAVELDPVIILKSSEINFDQYPDALKGFFDGFLHKVYYTTVSGQYNCNEFFNSSFNNVTLKLFVNDARRIVGLLKDSFDLIFLDPFSPNKSPELWTVDFLKELYRLLNPDGILVSYSSSFSVVGALKEAGFFVGNTKPVGRKSPGTIATKDINLIYNPLSPYQLDMLDTTAGIPFEDPELCWSLQEIFEKRKLKQKTSGRISASSLRNKSTAQNIVPSDKFD